MKEPWQIHAVSRTLGLCGEKKERTSRPAPLNIIIYFLDFPISLSYSVYFIMILSFPTIYIPEGRVSTISEAFTCEWIF